MATLFMFLLMAGGVQVPAARGQGDEQAVHRFDLPPGLSALVDFEGGLTIHPAGSRYPLLQTEVVSARDPRRRRPSDTFSAVVGEGVAGGHRGFSSRADDDRDGRIDEDPLDGIDNDGDGRIDEDFAAISDAMVAVHLGGGPGQAGVRMEYYHWGQSSLGSAVFLNTAGGPEAAAGGRYRIHTFGPDWQETEISSLLHTVVGQPEEKHQVAFVSRVVPEEWSNDGDPCTTDAGLWLGVMVLDTRSTTRFLLDGDRLEFALGQAPVPLVLCTAESWLQLNRTLGEARRLYEGLTDPVDKRRARWIVPPACSACRSSGAPSFGLDIAADGKLTLSAALDAGQCGLLDPDLFQLDGRPLGAPREIRWVPVNGTSSSIGWTCTTDENLREGGPADPASFVKLAGLLSHQTRGRLEFVFDRPDDIPAGILEVSSTPAVEVAGRCLDGRPFRTPLRPAPSAAKEAPAAVSAPNPETEMVEQTARGYAEDRARILNADPHSLSLSPDLLMGWPNPFNDIISIRFTVPRTMKEAFVWKNAADQPMETNLEGEVPWSGGQPLVSVKIYSINGQELVTLHSAALGAGEYTAHWNGADAFGRKVASGTYFCKLQMDDWSVTRRLVFIR